ncbi:MAG TPA: DinB family protein [Burkholderiales bacterium]
MNDTRTARTLTRYNAWANGIVFEAVAGLPEGEATKERQSVFKNMVHTLNHIYVIDRIFQAHLEGREHGYTARNTPTHPSLAQLWQAQQAVDAWYVDWSDHLTAPQLEEQIAFTFVGGGEGRMSRAEILLHLVNHTSFHRGFVGEMLCKLPVRAPATDFTVFLRDARPVLS